ncbi:MAG: efflux RND transporter permease subunit [Eubacterium sp.]|nr:efflux RND transporter permease subunit [Eubacterium sp.]
MLSKFSVKRPYTVLVGVVLILVLGYVAYTKMTADLLPNMSFPYVIVITTDIGASPEEVEADVTAKLEASLATTSNLKTLQSISRNSVSMVILEYEQTANMDSTMIELQQKLDQVTAGFGDTIGAPIVMQINPDMLPIMVGAVGVENMNPAEITTYVETSIIPQLESIEGVASVTASGGIEETIQVTLNQDKIDRLNDKVLGEIRNQFKDAEDEIQKGKDEIESGKAELESGKQTLADQVSAGETELNTRKIQLYTSEAEMNRQLVELQSTQQSLDNAIQMLTQTADGAKQLKDGIQQLDAGIVEMKGVQESLAPLAMLSDEELQAATGMDRETYNAQMTELATKIAEAEAQRVALQTQLDTLNAQIGTLGQTFSQYGVKLESVDDIPAAIEALEQNKSQVAVGIATIQEAQKQVEAGKATIDQALTALNKNEILGSLKISDASTQLITGAAALENAQKTIDTTKADAEAKADINSVLSADVIRQLLVAQNFDMPAGYINEEEDKYLIKVGESIKTVDDLSNLVLIDLGMDSIGKVYLTDIADVELVDNSNSSYARVDGKPGLLLTFEKQTGYATADVTDKILAKFRSLEKTEEESIHFSTMMDQGVYIDIIVSSILKNMGLGALLAIAVLLIFLRDFRPTLIIACAIPLSVVFAVVLMYFSSISLNIISMSGLALGIGMLVDNSIVVIENIFRLHKEGMPAKQACVNGASQVAGAITSSTLTTVCVFAPIVFTEGITRQLFVDMGLTILYTLGASLVIALTLVPAMAQGMLRKPKEIRHGLYDRFLNVYGKFLRKAMKLKILVFLAAIGLLVLSVFLALSKGTAFMPEMTSTQVTVTLSVPEEQSREFEEMTGYADQLMENLKDVDDIETIGAMAGSGTMLASMGGMGGSSGSLTGSGSGGNGTSITMYVLLDQQSTISNEEIEEIISNASKDLDCDVKIKTSMMDMSMLYGSGVTIQVRGRELDVLQDLAREVGGALENVEGVEKVNNGLRNMEKEVYIAVDKEKAAKYGMTVAQVFQLVYKKTAETSSSMKLSTATKDYDVYVNSAEQASMTREDLSKMTFTYKDQKTGDETEVKLTDIVSIGEREEMAAINREAQTRYIQVKADIKEGYNVGLVGNDVEKAVNQIKVPEGYSIKIAGENEAINEAMSQLVLMLILAVVLIYLIMVAQFQSLLSPFIIMFTIPLAFTGGFLSLYFTGSEVSVISLIGFVMLSGIIVNNGIVLVDYVNQLRRSGMAKKDAIVESAQTRLRPVLMTALTTIISMSTMAMGIGRGSEMAQPMAIVTVGGLVYGTLLTLVVVPCIYDALNREKDMREEDIQIVKEEEDPDLVIIDEAKMKREAAMAASTEVPAPGQPEMPNYGQNDEVPRF